MKSTEQMFSYVCTFLHLVIYYKVRRMKGNLL